MRRCPARLTVLCVLFMTVFPSCSRTPSPPSDPAERAEYWRKLDAEYEDLTKGYDEETGATQIRVEELKKRIEAGEKIVLLDIREDRENAVSALPGAKHIHPDDVEQASPDVSKDTTIVTYCTAGYRSGMAAVKLEKRLGRAVLNLHGGIVSWYNAGGEVRDPSGQPTDEIDAYGPDWQKYVHPRD